MGSPVPAASRLSLVPHSPQNFCSEELVAPQEAHTTARRARTRRKTSELRGSRVDSGSTSCRRLRVQRSMQSSPILADRSNRPNGNLCERPIESKGSRLSNYRDDLLVFCCHLAASNPALVRGALGRHSRSLSRWISAGATGKEPIQVMLVSSMKAWWRDASGVLDDIPAIRVPSSAGTPAAQRPPMACALLWFLGGRISVE